MLVVLPIEIDLQAGHVDPASLLSVALCLLYLADQARIHSAPLSYQDKQIGTSEYTDAERLAANRKVNHSCKPLLPRIVRWPALGRQEDPLGNFVIVR